MHRQRTTILAGVLLAITLLANQVLAQGSENNAAKVKEAMKEMIASAKKLGAPKLEGSTLMFGTTKMNGNYALVDSLKAKYKCTATVFAKEGDGFVRVATNVMKDDGSRADGTVLDPKGPAIAAIKLGKAYYGVADVLGKKFEAGYEPIKNGSGEIIGICYAGFQLK